MRWDEDDGNGEQDDGSRKEYGDDGDLIASHLVDDVDGDYDDDDDGGDGGGVEDDNLVARPGSRLSGDKRKKLVGSAQASVRWLQAPSDQRELRQISK